LSRLREEYATRGRTLLFESLQPCLTQEGDAPTYAEIAARLGLTEPAVKMAAHRLRTRYRELLRDEIAQTVTSPEEVEAEVQHLFAAFA
jgi:DNA-directed RNA polymerase specialized sigma24 family protein